MRTLLLPLITALIAAAALLGGCQNNQEPGTATLPDACSQPPESGMCKAAFQRYYYDADSGSCQTFIWGGCKGSVPFETLEACTQACNATGSPAPAKGAPVSTSANKEAQQ